MDALNFQYLAPMSADDAVRFRESYEECRAEAAKAASSSAKQQWLLFAEEWLRLAQAAEAQRSEAASPTVVPAK